MGYLMVVLSLHVRVAIWVTGKSKNIGARIGGGLSLENSLAGARAGNNMNFS